MSEEKRHPNEPAEGAEEDVGTSGADRPDRERDEEAKEGSAGHPREPAEGSEDDVESPGADRPNG